MIYKLLQNRVERTYRGGGRIEKFTGEKLSDKVEGYYSEDWTASVTSVYKTGNIKANDGLGRTTDGRLVKDITNNNLPILVKLLDSDERLVVQAHPTREFANKFMNSSFGKTECWFFIDCTPDAYVYLGFKKGVTKEKFMRAFNENDSNAMLDMLHKIPVKKNDFIFVDGGVPHAIGGGCFIVELQEPSDLMVVGERYTPSGRKIDEDRLHMGLGFEKMFDVFDYTGYALSEIKDKYFRKPQKISDGVYEILGADLTDKFSMYLLCGSTDFVINKPFAVGIVIQGSAKINNIEAESGNRLLISDKNLSVRGNANILICM